MQALALTYARTVRGSLCFVAAMMVVVGCSSFEPAGEPAVDAGAVDDAGRPDGGADAREPAPLDAGPDAAPEQVYAWGFEREDGWGHPAADLSTVNARTSKGLVVRGNSSGTYSADSQKRIGLLGAGSYLVRVWVRHERTDGIPTLGATLKSAIYASTASNVTTDETTGSSVALNGTWTELTVPFLLRANDAIPTVTVTATAGSSGMRGAFVLDDLTIERLP